MRTKTEAAVDLLRSLEHQLDGQIRTRQHDDLRRDLNKLIKLLENPIFKENLNVQESLRRLKDKIHCASNWISESQTNCANDIEEGRSGRHDRQARRVSLAIPVDSDDEGQCVGVSPVSYGEVREYPLLVTRSVSSPRIANVLTSWGRGPPAAPSADSIPSRLHEFQDHPYAGSHLRSHPRQPGDCSGPHWRSVSSQAQQGQSSSDYTEIGGPTTTRRPGTEISQDSSNMVLHGEWTQVQVVELENDGSGLGFGIVGGRSTGVVIKTILAGGPADRDGRLRPGDHLLQINEVHLHGMSSEQVAMILRQQDQAVVRIVVGRPTSATSPHPSHSSYQDVDEGKQMDDRGSFTVPTKVASDPVLLDEHLQQTAEAWAAQKEQRQLPVEETAKTRESLTETMGRTHSTTAVLPKGDLSALASNTFSKENRRLEEYDELQLTLKRDPESGLGIAVACYVHKNEEIAGLFVRNLLPGSVSAADGRVRQHDQIVKVNEHDIDEARSHKEAIKYLAESGDVVELTLVRYHQSSNKFHYLEMLASQDTDRQPIDLHSASSSTGPVAVSGCREQPAGGEDETVKRKWFAVVGEDYDLVMTRIERSAQKDGVPGQQHFGIALEGTVDVVNGTELRPHHYIRSVSPDSAAAACGNICAGDELLEANGRDLYGKSYLEVVDILKQLSSSDIQLVCARPKSAQAPSSLYHPSGSTFKHDARSDKSSARMYDRLIKAKSEASLLPSGQAGHSGSCDSFSASDRLLTEPSSALRSRSLEPLTNLAVWSVQPIWVELMKGDRGLGFSVLDYQDPLHPSDVVIVVRSLVPGGVAAVDGGIVPGDRLLFVNDVDLTCRATLEKAVDALKSAPKGLVRLGIAKPLPLDQNVQSPVISQTERLLAKGGVSSPQPNRKWSVERRRNVNGGQQYRSGDVYGEDVTGPPPVLSRLPPPDWTLEARRRLYPEAYAEYEKQQRAVHGERVIHRQSSGRPVRQTASASTVLYGYAGETAPSLGSLPQSVTANTLISGSYLSMSSWSGGSSPSLSPAASPSLLRGSWAADVVQLPAHLEQTIKVKKQATDPLGVTVEAVDKAINGCLVKSMLRSGAFGKDGRVGVGDSLVRMNNENLRNVTNSQARAILKRTNLLGTTEFSAVYIPSLDAEKYRDYVAKQLPVESPMPNVNRLSPKSPYVPRRHGVQSTGESDVSSDAEMSCRDGDGPVSPTSRQTTLDSELSRRSPSTSQPPQPAQDDASTASSTALMSPIDYAHYPVSGDQYLQQYYETRALHTATTPESRPLPTVTEVSESRSSPDKENERLPDEQGKCATMEEEEEEEAGSNGDDGAPRNTAETTEPGKTTESPTVSLGARSKYWGEPRTVELTREAGRSLGISIVGGRVEVSKGAPGTGTTVSGIFIKSVIPHSPAGRCGQLNMGDRILSVNGVDLKDATHEQAVEVIRNAASPVRFIVQSLHSVPVQSTGSPHTKRSLSPGQSVDWAENEQRIARVEGVPAVANEQSSASTPVREQAPESASKVEVEESGVESVESERAAAPTVVEASVVVMEPRSEELSVVSEEAAAVEEEEEEEEGIDTFTGDDASEKRLERRPSEPVGPAVTAPRSVDRRYSAAAVPSYVHKKPVGFSLVDTNSGYHRSRVDSASAAMIRKADDDSESEDEFGYTQKKMKAKYGDLKGDLVMVELEKGANGLGLSLAGHRDRSKLSVFVVGVQRDSSASLPAKVAIGDELLEINGIVLHGRSHLNASAIIKGVHESNVKLLVLRRPDAIEDMAVNPIQYNPSVQRWMSHTGAVRSTMDSPSSQSVAGMNSKTSVSAALSVDLAYTANTESKESAERTPGRQSIVEETAGSPGSLSPPSFSTPRQVRVHKGPSGFGVTLTDGSTNDNMRGIFVTHISPDSPCAQDKVLKIGDQVLLVNGRSVSDLTSTKVAEMIQDSSEVELTVSSHTIVPLPHSPAPPTKKPADLAVNESTLLQRKVSGSVSPNLACNQIVPGYETQIEIEKGGKGLGLSIVGGTDTVLGSVVIHEVYPDGAAAKDGRLQPGDQLLEVNSQSLRQVAHETAITILRQTPSKVRLLVYRDPNLQLSLLDPTQIYNIFEVELMKKPGKGLGLSIVGRKTEPGVFISEVVKGGVADADGRLMQGDQILAVNSQDLTNAMQEQAATILKTCMGKVVLKVGRWKLTSGNNPNPTFPVSKILAPSGAISPTVPAISVHQAKPTVVGAPSDSPSAPRPSPSPPPPAAQQPPPFDVQVQSACIGSEDPGMVECGKSRSLTNGDHGPSTSSARSPAANDGRSTPRSLALNSEPSAADAAVTPTGSPSPKLSPQPSTSEDTKCSVAVLDLSEEGCDTVLVEMQKHPDRPLGMGIGKRPRGILVTSIQPNTVAADKLRVGDRILAVNGRVVSDQQSAVNYVKNSGPRLVLQLARPRPEHMDLATGNVRTSLTTIKRITLQRGREGGFGFCIDGGEDGKEASSSSGPRNPIYICSVTKNSPAAQDGRMKVGDVLLAVNNESVQNATQAHVIQLIKQSNPNVTLTLMANPKHKRRNS